MLLQALTVDPTILTDPRKRKILAPVFEAAGVNLVDLETEEEMTTQPYQIQKAYIEAMQAFTGKIKSECLNSKIEYNLITTDTPFDKALFNYIQKRSKIN